MLGTSYDFVIIGSGIVGLTVAQEITFRHPSAKIAILDKEQAVGVHASGRNSGVLHCGIYYSSDTLKARLCSSGAKQMIEFAKEHSISYKQSGKVILAVDEKELSALDLLLQNATENNINAQKIDSKLLQEIEPCAAEVSAAIYCPDTAVIDSSAVLKRLKDILVEKNIDFLLECEFIDKPKAKAIRTSKGIINFGYLFNCAGSYADIVAKKFGLSQDYTLIPFKGIYWKLNSNITDMVRSNIYPVPDTSLPFLGMHFTRVISGDVYIGPTAIPALGRENYSNFENIEFKELVEIGSNLTGMYVKNNDNFRKLAHTEIRKYLKTNFLKTAQKLIPSLSLENMAPTAKVGIRPQLINRRNKQLEMDYILEHTENSTHVLNAISPAFTSSFAFSKMIVDSSKT
ncbi:MAG: L-2-hydroxyglutarate oxidase [Methylococcales bacterium]